LTATEREAFSGHIFVGPPERLPEEKRTRLKLVAKSRNVSVTKLIEEMATILLADLDADAVRQGGRERTLIVLVVREGLEPSTPAL
jgi:hypothetical protein